MSDKFPVPVYDFDLAIRTIRDKMDAGDYSTQAAVCIAKGYVEVIRGNLTAEELEPAARGLILSGGTLGHLSNRMEALGLSVGSINMTLNIQSIAAVMILDTLEIDRLEAELEAGS